MAVSDAMIQKLRAQAERAAERAYAPYSNFKVGAAVLGAGGQIFAAPNVENASYGLTICAERNAIFQAVAAGERQISALVLFTPTAQPTAPCGACRQVLSEFGPEAEVFSFSPSGASLRTTAKELLPGAFGPASLDRGKP